VGSLESASAAAERESGVEAAGGFADGGVEAAVVAPIGTAVAGLAGATAEFWQNAPVANSMAAVIKVILRIFQSKNLAKNLAQNLAKNLAKNLAPGRPQYRNARVRRTNWDSLAVNVRQTMTNKRYMVRSIRLGETRP
jgi:hypothetical protein